MLILAAIFAVLVGLVLGLLGGGGSILMLPILVYVLRVPAAEAVGMSLLVVGTTSSVALTSHLKSGNIRWRTGFLFGGSAMLTAYAAGRLGRGIPAPALLIGFGVLMLVTATLMLRARPKAADTEAAADFSPQYVLRIALQGAAVGAVAGLVGAGGGFLIVPTLLLVARFPMQAAVPTSLLVITLQSAAGFLGKIDGLHLDWTLTLVATVFASAGSIAGSRLARKVPQDKLRKAFAWLVLSLGSFMILKELTVLLGRNL
jgi:uncharacterized protein